MMQTSAVMRGILGKLCANFVAHAQGANFADALDWREKMLVHGRLRQL